MICYFDRNDELFRLLKMQCIEGLYGGERAEGCQVVEDSNGSEYITFDSFSSDFTPITIEAKREFNSQAPHMPQVARFSLYMGESCQADGSNRFELPAYRVCDDPDNGESSINVDFFSNPVIEDFRISVETFLGRFLAYGFLDKDELKADDLVYSYGSGLMGQPAALQQIYPTSLVMDFASKINFEEDLEGIMAQFKERFSKISKYNNTPFAERGWDAPDLFVCRRSAHEIFATKYMFGCGEFAAAWMAVLRSAGIESRLVKVVGAGFKGRDRDIGHDLVEVREPNTGEWVLTDPAMGRVHRKYKGERQFTAYAHRWIEMGRWQSNWEAGCYDKMDSTRMRAKAFENNNRPDDLFVSIDGSEPKD